MLDSIKIEAGSKWCSAGNRENEVIAIANLKVAAPVIIVYKIATGERSGEVRCTEIDNFLHTMKPIYS